MDMAETHWHQWDDAFADCLATSMAVGYWQKINVSALYVEIIYDEMTVDVKNLGVGGKGKVIGINFISFIQKKLVEEKQKTVITSMRSSNEKENVG